MFRKLYNVLNNLYSKIDRTKNILIDKSEAFKDNPAFRLDIIINIWKSN